MSVSIEGNSVQTDVYHNKNGAIKYYVEDGKIVKIIERRIYETRKGSLVIEQERDNEAKKGDLAFLGDEKADGKFKIHTFTNLYIEKGIIIKVSAF